VRTICAGLLALAAAGCVSTYAGTARPADPSMLEESGWLAARGVPVILQETRQDCGAAALAMILSYYGDPLAAKDIATSEQGIRADTLRDFAKQRGHSAFRIPATLHDLEAELMRGRPVIVGVEKPQRDGVLLHYEVVVGIHAATHRIATIDPAVGLTVNSIDGFEREWRPAQNLALVISPKETAPRHPSR
jgi:ABC-type bacteriocin/lantibiotic exporter with double-glycine peptidase domain